MSISFSGTNGLTFPDATTQTTGGYTGFRNRIINGGMTIAQRGTSFNGQNGYALDRWYCNRSGGVAGVTFAQTYGAYGVNKYWMYCQRNSGDTSAASGAMYQPIEGVNCRDMAGGNVTASFTIASGGTLSVTSSNVSIALNYQTTTTDIGVAGSWTTISTQSFSVASNTSPTRYTATFTVPANATQLVLVLSFSFSGTAGADDRYYITEVQLEKGSVATPFENRPYGLELSLCQRYYEKSFDIAQAVADGVYSACYLGYVCYADTWVISSPSIPFKVPKRSTPTMAFYGSSGFWQVNTDSDTWVTFGAIHTGFQSSTGVHTTNFSVGVHKNTGSGYALYSAHMIRGDWTASAEL